MLKAKVILGILPIIKFCDRLTGNTFVLSICFGWRDEPEFQVVNNEINIYNTTF